MSPDLNETAAIRAGEELPVRALAEYLAARLPSAQGALTVEQFPQGHSNLTYLLKLGDREWVLRRPPFGNQVKTAHDMGREYRILARLCEVYAPAPRPELYCDDENIIGAPFYLMERRHGVALRRRIPSGLTITSDMARNMSCALIDNLAALHGIDYRAAGLGDVGKPEGFVARQVHGWSERYAKAQTEDVPSMTSVGEWLKRQIPAESGAAILHNDYKYDNLLFDPADLTRITAVLDWEMATIGDPLMDLGTTLAYWVEASDSPTLRQAAFGPTALAGSLSRVELMERYQEKAGRDVANPMYYYCFGLYKLAVIVQQIYARFVRGHTQDSRFADLGALVHVLGVQADRAIRSGSIAPGDL
jgi:aminoglycoside phosphotransferase (APT) family kinase protein